VRWLLAVAGLLLLLRPRVMYAEGVELGTVTPAGRAIEAAGSRAFAAAGYPAIVTSARDGRHMTGSAHYAGNARDFRSTHVGTTAEKYAIVAAMLAELGPEFDVFLETEPEHIHAELDPTRATPGRW